MRITIPDFMRLVEEQTDGKIKVSGFYPVPTVVPVSKAIGAFKGKRYVEFTAPPAVAWQPTSSWRTAGSFRSRGTRMLRAS
ncbi:MAG TPA: hypothetical protein ENF85_02580 [Candidatus Bathyarchaeota archaeon]|nr:hypothetical protein [Candidatus Bathyarchaeota archaeon]